MLSKIKVAFSGFINILVKVQTIRHEAYVNYAHRMW
jgi:hypothetical protein